MVVDDLIIYFIVLNTIISMSEFDCSECKIMCGKNCLCRWCHFSSCVHCDEILCDIRYCKDTCHGDKGGSNFTPLITKNPNQQEGYLIEPLINLKSASMIEEEKVIEPPTSPKPNLSNLSFLKKMKNVQNKPTTLSFFKNLDGLYELAIELERGDAPKDNMSRSSSFQGFDLEANDEINPRSSNLTKRTSKYQGMTKGSKLNQAGFIISDNRKTLNKNDQTAVTFRYKSKDTARRSDQAILKQMELRELSENLDVEARKKNSLAEKLKALFNRKRIADLNSPLKLDLHVTDKFKRDKSEVSKNFTSLDQEIRNEMYEKKNLRSNVFEDFEKQESWQSYTTLLFADIVVNDLSKSRSIKK